MTVKAATTTSNRPDTKVLNRLVAAEKVCLAVAALIAATVLLGWELPAIGAALPRGWSLMKANTALAVLLCTASLSLLKPRLRAPFLFAGKACAVMALFLAGASLFEHWTGRATGLGTLLAPDTGGSAPGRMSIQTASFFVLLGLSLLIRRTRQDLLGHVLDVLIGAAVLLVAVLVAGQALGASALFGQNPTTRTSPQTLVCLALLAFVQACRRARYGYFSVLVGVGIGSHIARIALPMSLVVVFLFVIVGQTALAKGQVTLPYAVALTASSMAAILCLLVVFLSRKINEMERALRDMSLTDELTGLHNRRGFYLLGEQALRNARRDKRPVTVFFVDADGLKTINDTLGHDVGSELLRDIALLLRKSFRSSDVVGRLGGDEFAVITGIGEADLASVLLRLNREAEIANEEGNKPYRISCSTGRATAEPESDEPFAALVERADAAMYLDKRQRREARETGGTAREPAAADAASRHV